MSISQLCISVPLSTSCTDFTVNSKFLATHGSYLQCWLFSVSCKQDASDYQQNTPEYTCQRNETIFPENWTDFLPEEIQSKIVYIYSVVTEYSLRGRDVHSTPSSTPSWHKWSDFEYRPWCLAIIVHWGINFSVSNNNTGALICLCLTTTLGH